MKKTHESGGVMGNIITLIVLIALVIVIIFATKGNEETEMTNENQEVSEGTEISFEGEQYMVTIQNLSDDQALSPGLYAVHTADTSLDYEGRTSPAAFESLSEYGDTADLQLLLSRNPEVLAIYTVAEPIPAGEMASFNIALSEDQLTEDLFLSGVQMVMGSNDGFALLDARPLNQVRQVVPAMNYDNGSEENSALNSGFEGGQPDSSRGEENISNGTSTVPAAPVTEHPQLTDTVMQVTIEPLM